MAPIVVEETVNGALQRTYTYGLQRIRENQIVNNTWPPSFYEYDGMGSGAAADEFGWRGDGHVSDLLSSVWACLPIWSVWVNRE